MYLENELIREGFSLNYTRNLNYTKNNQNMRSFKITKKPEIKRHESPSRKKCPACFETPIGGLHIGV